MDKEASNLTLENFPSNVAPFELVILIVIIGYLVEVEEIKMKKNALNPHFSKWRRGKIKGVIRNGTHATYAMAHGDYGLIACEKATIKEISLEEVQKSIVRGLDRKGKLWRSVTADTPRTKKGIGARMGKGKGAIDHYIARVREGMVLFQISGVEEHEALHAFTQGQKKLGLKSKMIKRGKVLPPDYDIRRAELAEIEEQRTWF